MATTQSNGKPEGPAAAAAISSAAMLAPKVPSWVEASLFEPVLKKSVNDFKKILNFKAYPAMTAGENYATVMLRVEIDVELKDGKSKTVSYMMKVAHDNPMFTEMLKKNNIFLQELNVYQKVVPELEQMYKAAGVDVTFSANYHTLSTTENYVLLDDLRPRGFKNANRLEGFDMEHTKRTLKKLAMWHAATATRIETKGQFDMNVTGFFSDDLRDVMAGMFEGISKSFLQCVKQFEGNDLYYASLEKIQPKMMDELSKLFKCDPNDFKVLNHGDCWANNIMFQYDAFGKIKETFFVDHQIATYGSPAQDLLYFLVSSPKLELKIKEFDYFIKFYYDNLVENLKLLKYPKKFPALKEIHIALYKYGLWAYCTVTGVMGAVLLDPTEKATIDNFLGEGEASKNFQLLMFSNARYKKHAEVILPWLYNRGAMEC